MIYLPVFTAHLLHTTILANPVILCVIENLPLFHEDLISQELILLFHDVLATQRHHALAAPQDLPEDFGVPLCMTITWLPNCILSILHFHGLHTFIEQIPSTIIYSTF